MAQRPGVTQEDTNYRALSLMHAPGVDVERLQNVIHEKFYLVQFVCSRLKIEDPEKVEIAELALVEAARLFQPDGHSFAQYAVQHIARKLSSSTVIAA